MLNRKNIRTKRPMEKLNHQMFGSFMALWKVSHATYVLQLPERWGIHLVFNVGLLELYQKDTCGHRTNEVSIPDIVDNEPSYIIVGVLDSHWYARTKQKFPQ